MADPPSTTGLLSLPPTLLQRILTLALDQDATLSLPLISSLGKHIAQHAGLPILLQHLTLEDDDALLVDCEEQEAARRTSFEQCSRAQTPLAAIWSDEDKASHVQHLTIVKPRPLVGSQSRGESTTPHDDDASAPQADEGDAALFPPPMHDIGFLLLLSKLPSLRSFTWHAARNPPPQLCPALGAACKNLTEFTFELAECAGATGVQELGSPRIGGGGVSSSGGGATRWDAPELSALPVTLTSLALSNLSQCGTRELAAALPSFPALEELELARTVFIDDALLGEIGASARKLRRFTVREMSGTKLSETGLGEVLDQCGELEELTLDCVQGRFSKSCWTKLEPLPEQLHTLSIYYSEASPHKSWTLDHLGSLPSAISSSSLINLTVSRKPQPGALVPGYHHFTRYPLDPVMALKVLTPEMVEALLERGDEWRCLNLDLWTVGPEDLKKIMDGCLGLVSLTVLFDEHFRALLTLASSFALSQNLRWFHLSIDPSRTPELNTMSFTMAPSRSSTRRASSSPGISPSSSITPLPSIPSDLPASPTTSRRPSLISASSGTTVSTASYESRSPIAGREWRRFLKKTHRLEYITWGGRGGVGTWRFERGPHHSGSGAGAGKVEVEFEPIVMRVPSGQGQEGAWALQEEGLASPGAGSVSWKGERRRRSSSASLAGSCLSGLALSSPPTSPETSFSALGFSPTSMGAREEYDSPPKSLKGGFGAIGSGVVGAGGSKTFGLGLTGFSPVPAVTPAPAPIASTSPPLTTSPQHGRNKSTSLPSASAVGPAPTPTPAPAPRIYPGGWHTPSSGGGKQGGSSNLGKEKERHLEREREKERERVKEREVERQAQASAGSSPKSSRGGSPVELRSGGAGAGAGGGGGGGGGFSVVGGGKKGGGRGKASGSGGPKGGAPVESKVQQPQTQAQVEPQQQQQQRVIPGLPASAMPAAGGKKGRGRK